MTNLRFEEILTNSRKKTILATFCILTLFVLIGRSAKAQDATVYVSHFDIGKTVSNLLFQIDKNGFTYLNTFRKKANANNSNGYSGRVQIITFDDSGVDKIMACEPTAALEFPMRIIVWEEEGDIYISYINPFFYKRRHHIRGCDEIINDLNKRMIKVVNDAIKKQQ